MRRPRRSPRQITEAEEAMLWLRWLKKDDARLVCHPVSATISSMVAPPLARSISISFACFVPLRGLHALGAELASAGASCGGFRARRFVAARGRAVAALRLDADGGEPHHGPAFFELLDEVMHDWERRKQRLKRAMA